MSKNINTIRHGTAHLFAAAVQELYPKTKFGVGPVVEHGFYYDMEVRGKDSKGVQLCEADLKKIQRLMKKMKARNEKFVRKEMGITAAINMFKKMGQGYKVELLKDLKEKGTTKKESGIKNKELGKKQKNRKVSIYELGKFVDLCRGPHVELTKDLKVFKLHKIAGAYWRGDEKNKMLTRVYGLVFETAKEMEDYLQMLKDAKKRDHRKLGKELDLFTFSELVGPGLPLFAPKGVIIKEELQREVERICRGYGFEKVATPHLAKIELYNLSGHAKKFGDELLHVKSHYKQDYILKPVQCPHQTQIYVSRPRSYRDLPIRYMESEKQYRDEKPGEIGGLNRVIAITVEDGHSFCTIEQVKQEAKNMVEIIKQFYSAIGLWGKHWVSLSVRDYNHPEKYIGESKDWDKCEKMLEEISEEMKLDAKRCEGEAALYGPKLDFMFTDALGREIQIPTVQLDFATPKRFGLVYTNKEGKEDTPVMVHRAILGSYERFLVLLIEHYAGAFPLWLAPVQVQIIPVGEAHRKSADKLAEKLKEVDVRAFVDNSDESVGYKIRKAEKEKIPYMLVVGDKEKSLRKLSVREKRKKETYEMLLGKFIEKIVKEIAEKK